MNNQSIYDFLKENGCCEICCLRYFKCRGNDYDDISGTFKKLSINISEVNSSEEEITEKKIKLNSCAACLGLFSNNFLDDIIDKILEHPDLKKYDSKQAVVAMSFPMLFHVRQLSFWLGLLEKFDKNFNIDKAPDVPLKEVAKLIINPKLLKKLDKSYDANGLMINIAFNHNDEDDTIQKIAKIENMSNREKRTNKKIEITRGFLERQFIPSRVSFKDFQSEFSVPPDIPTTNLCLENITFNGPTIFVAGRYQKFSRKLSHTPWVLHGKRVMEDSIQEIIIRAVSNYFGVADNKIIFSSSGREDVDVRCLGNGRPFVLEIPDSKSTSLPMDIAASMELEVEKSKVLSIHSLQIVKREELVHIKTGEEKKRKTYRALCKLENPVTIEILKILNIEKEFQIEQLTPIRVLHRRPYHNRPRTIYSVKASIIPTNKNVVILDIVAQAGTYIKELVHGEFGRTIPSFQSMIGQEIDIIALDVLGIDLDWPKEIRNR